MSEGQYDAPNQQVVRADGSAPWDEGTGGPVGSEPKPAHDDLDSMTKAELVAYAEERGVEVDQSMTKDEIRQTIG